MARLARVVAPLIPQDATHRVNRRQQVFFADDDYRAYLDLLGRYTRAGGRADLGLVEAFGVGARQRESDITSPELPPGTPEPMI